MLSIIYSFLFLVLAFQAFVSFRVMRSDVYEREQKRAQLTFIWLLPALGAVIAFWVLRDSEQPAQYQRDKAAEQRRA